jgi:hypothetical protein
MSPESFTKVFEKPQSELNAEEYKAFKISLPELPEQQKITSFLSSVDEKIQQLTRKATLLEQYKKGVMQQLFSGKLRFKDENGKDYADWEEKKLGEVAKLKANARIHLIVDEAHCLKDVGTANYKTVRDFAMDRTLQLLTGTPLNKPEDAYAYTKLIAPHLYRNLNHFNMLHVVEVDFYKKPCKYGNLDMLQANFKVNAARATKEEVLTDLPPMSIQVMEYDLAPAHLKLYRTLVEQKLLEYGDGTKLDATQASALWHALGQIVMNWGHFAQEPELISAGFDVLDEVLDELGDRKLVVFSHYKMTNRLIRERYGCASVYSEVSDKQKEIDRFINDPKCRIINMQPGSGGVGVDGLQHVCQDVLYLEPPITPAHLTQSLSRVYRQGQKHAVADGVIIAPYRFHHVIVLVLNRAGVDGDVSCIFLKVYRQRGGVKNGHVRLRARSHVL